MKKDFTFKILLEKAWGCRVNGLKCIQNEVDYKDGKPDCLNCAIWSMFLPKDLLNTLINSHENINDYYAFRILSENKFGCSIIGLNCIQKQEKYKERVPDCSDCEIRVRFFLKNKNI